MSALLGVSTLVTSLAVPVVSPRAPGGDEWSALDGARPPALAQGESPFSFGVLVRTFFTMSEKEAADDVTDVSGFVFEDVDLWLALDHGDVSARVSADFDDESGAAELEDANARWRALDWLAVRMGQFKPRVVRSGSIADDGLLFRERTFLGAAFDAWDDGVELGGHYDQFDWWLALTDGANGSDADHFWSARGEWALYDAAFDDVEGARGSPNHLRVLVGASVFHDVAQSSSDGGGVGADLALTFGPYAFHVEWAELDDEFARTIDVFNGYLVTVGDGHPLSATLSRRIGDVEAALRVQSADDADETEAVGIGAGWTPDAGPLRVVADLELVEGETRDFSLFSLGVQLGSSGLARPFALER